MVRMGNPENLFILKPSDIRDAGVGCFAVSTVTSHTRLNGQAAGGNVRMLHEQDIPDPYLKYCMLLASGKYMAPTNFAAMSVFWYINHARQPNITIVGGKLHTARKIDPGEELTLYYPDLLTHPKNKHWVRPEHI